MNSDLTSSASSNHLFKNVDLLGLLAAGLYGFLTLLPDSSTLMLSWPWVIVWEIMLIIPWLWLLKHFWLSQSFIPLGFGLDYGAGLIVIGLLGSCLVVPFPTQAIWYSWAFISAIVAIYGLNTWCSDQKRRTHLLQIQAGLACTLIIVSLGLWSSQTFLPELNRLSLLRNIGLDLSYNFSTLELRNWAPFGHQNYVAGYLVLSLPLLLGQSLVAKTRLVRWCWIISLVLGFVTLFTTSSRGGWLGLSVSIGVGGIILLTHQYIPLWLRLLPSVLFVSFFGIALTFNNRLRDLLTNNPFENTINDPYRLITNVTGWLIGQDHPFLGAGPGSIPLLFQKYRPNWAGLEAEWHYQLHSTPAHLWAELGIWGIALSLGFCGWCFFWGLKLWKSPQLKGENRILCLSLLIGLFGYAVMCITDYQLNIIAISGTLIIYNTCLLSMLRDTQAQIAQRQWRSPKLRVLACASIGFLVAMSFWVAPILKAWQLSHLGFEKLQNKEIGPFVQALEQSHQLAPWESYYLYQLGSHIGKLGLTSKDQEFRKTLLDQGQAYFQASVIASPYQEYGFTNLGWLQLNNQKPAEAVQSFSEASRLFPGRKLGFHELGLSLLEINKVDLAVLSFSLEIVRNPLWMTSPVWNDPQLKPLYPEVMREVEKIYQNLLQDHKSGLQPILHRTLGCLYWWNGDSRQAAKHWKLSNTQFGLDLLGLDLGQAPLTKAPIYNAWLNPQEREKWVEQAFLIELKAIPDPQKVQAIVRGMDKATSLENWLKQNPLTVYATRTRTGFGINAGHIDGPPLQDFSVIVNNYGITTFFSSLFEMPVYNSNLDHALQPLREELWTAIENG